MQYRYRQRLSVFGRQNVKLRSVSSQALRVHDKGAYFSLGNIITDAFAGGRQTVLYLNLHKALYRFLKVLQYFFSWNIFYHFKQSQDSTILFGVQSYLYSLLQPTTSIIHIPLSPLRPSTPYDFYLFILYSTVVFSILLYCTLLYPTLLRSYTN